MNEGLQAIAVSMEAKFKKKKKMKKRFLKTFEYKNVCT